MHMLSQAYGRRQVAAVLAGHEAGTPPSRDGAWRPPVSALVFYPPPSLHGYPLGTEDEESTKT